MTFAASLGLLVAALLAVLAAFLATRPARVHGGRFATEYLLLAGTVGGAATLLALVSLWLLLG